MCSSYLIGSNIFNILSILGITSIITEIEVQPDIVNVDMIWMMGITFIILPMMLYRSRITRLEGGLLLVIYAYYTYSLLATGQPLPEVSAGLQP